MPHNEGVTASVSRIDNIIIQRNLFGGYDALLFQDSSDDPTEIFRDVRIGVENGEIREMIGADKWNPCYPLTEDIVLFCERSAGTLYWYKVKYAYDNQTNG